MNATAKFQYTAGAVVRGQIERELRRSAFDAGVEIKIEKFGGGWLEGDYGVTVRGDEARVKVYSAAVSNWMQKVARDCQ